MHVHVSAFRLILFLFLSAGMRLARLYLKRLDAKQAEMPPPERNAIAASRRRAQGHLWLLGVLMASLFVFALLFGVNRPPLDPKTLLLVVAIAVADVVFFHKMVSAYEDARRMRSTVAP